MRMKEVCERTGLTDRAVRLYMESGLLTPRQESNYMGRRSFSFDEEDVRVLEAVAILRRADFSIADILQMQRNPESLPDVVAAHQRRLAEEIATKERILGTLKQYDGQVQKDYVRLADAISGSASRNSIPKEDSGMNLKDFTRMIRKRIPALIALVLLLVAVFCVTTMALRTVFADVSVIPGGGYAIEFQWSAEPLGDHAVLLLSVAALMLGLVPLVIYLAGGKRYWLMVTVGLCALAIAGLLLMPAAQAERMYRFEFLAYRSLFLFSAFYNKLPQVVIQGGKFLPVVAALVLSCVGFFRDKPEKNS